MGPIGCLRRGLLTPLISSLAIGFGGDAPPQPLHAPLGVSVPSSERIAEAEDGLCREVADPIVVALSLASSRGCRRHRASSWLDRRGLTATACLGGLGPVPLSAHGVVDGEPVNELFAVGAHGVELVKAATVSKHIGVAHSVVHDAGWSLRYVVVGGGEVRNFHDVVVAA